MRSTHFPFLCVAVFLVLFSHRTSSACLCAVEPFEETAASADIAFLGEVLPGSCSEPQRVPEASWPADDPNGCFLAVHADKEQCAVVGAKQQLIDSQGKVIHLQTGEEGTSRECGLAPGEYTVRSTNPPTKDRPIEIHPGEVTEATWWDFPKDFLLKARIRVLKSYQDKELQDEYWIHYNMFGASCGLGFMAPGETWRIAANRNQGRFGTSRCSATRMSEAPPPGESMRGGCAGCHTAPQKRSDWWLAAAGALLVLVWRRRKLSRESPRYWKPLAILALALSGCRNEPSSNSKEKMMASSSDKQPAWRSAPFIAPQARITPPLPVRQALDFWAAKRSEFHSRNRNLLLLGGSFALLADEHETFERLGLKEQLQLANAHPIEEFFAKRESDLKDREGDPSSIHQAALEGLALNIPQPAPKFSANYDWAFVEEHPGAPVVLVDLPGTPLESIAAIMRFAPGDDWTRHQPYEHAQMAAHWAKTLGAQAVYLDGKSIYFVLDKPARTVEEAKRAIWECYLYNDAEEHVVGSVDSMSDYAQDITSTAQWGFDWD